MLRKIGLPFLMVGLIAIIYWYIGESRLSSAFETIYDFKRFGNSKMISEVSYGGIEDILYSDSVLSYTLHYGSVNISPLIKFRLEKGDYDKQLATLGIAFDKKKKVFLVGGGGGKRLEVSEKYKKSLFD